MKRILATLILILGVLTFMTPASEAAGPLLLGSGTHDGFVHG
jgi:di/tricarboxylate transporter